MTERENGRYLVIEGSDGAGKTTQKDLLIEELKFHCSNEVIDLIEPGATVIGAVIRGILLDPSIEKLPETELDLFTAARRELVHQVIKPKMENGAIVVCDRNWFSAVAYQGYGRGLDVNAIIEANRRAMGDYFMPDGIVILDIPIEVAAERQLAAGTKRDWFEKQDRQFFERVNEGYKWLAQEFNAEVIDGTMSKSAVHEIVFNMLGKIALE